MSFLLQSKAAVSLRQRQQVAMETEAPPTMTGITGPSTQGKTASNIASEGELSSGQDKAGKETVRKSQRITKGKLCACVFVCETEEKEIKEGLGWPLCLIYLVGQLIHWYA